MAGCLQPGSSIDEKGRLVNLMFSTEFGEKYRGYGGCSRRIEPYMTQAVHGGIDRGVKPISLVNESNHGLVDGNLIRVSTVCWL